MDTKPLSTAAMKQTDVKIKNFSLTIMLKVHSMNEKCLWHEKQEETNMQPIGCIKFMEHLSSNQQIKDKRSHEMVTIVYLTQNGCN